MLCLAAACRDRASGELLAVKLMQRPIPPMMGTNINMCANIVDFSLLRLQGSRANKLLAVKLN
jgi:hypothetical protein